MVLVGCGAKPAEPLERPTPLTPNEVHLAQRLRVPVGSTAAAAEVRPGLALPRPPLETQLDPPDVAELGRWPLTIAEHPALEPHFDVASALAKPGVSWTDLCARGAQHRHLASNQELVTYLGAWCSVIAGDYSAAIADLGVVRHSPNRRLVDALTLDVAAIVAAHGAAHDLESFLRAGGFLDVNQVDLASAAYFEVGRLDDAAEANRLARDMDHAPTDKALCARMLRGIADTTNSARDDVIEELRLVSLTSQQDGRVPRCVSEYAMVRCAVGGQCSAYWSTLVPPADSEGVELLGTVYRSWTTLRTANEWRFAGARLNIARPIGDSLKLLVPALELSLRLSRCDLSLVSDLEESIRMGLEELSPQDHSQPRSSPEVREKERERLLELGMIKSNEIQGWRARLETALAQAQHLWKLDPTACSAYLATMAPVQP